MKAPLLRGYIGMADPVMSRGTPRYVRVQSQKEFIVELWDVSYKHSESAFTGLYMFTLV
jgi:hypothetical protein